MTFSYIPNTPIATNDPADDQPNMLTNFQSIGAWTEVDHIGFNVANGGYHKQITFNDVAPAAVPGTPVSVLFTNNQDGLGTALPNNFSELFFYTGNNAASKNQYYIAQTSNLPVTGTEGSTLVTCGIILKWGVITNPPSTSSRALTFKSAFPNNCYSVQVTPDFTSTSAVRSATVSLVSNTGFTVYTTSSAFTSIYWFAVGN